MLRWILMLLVVGAVVLAGFVMLAIKSSAELSYQEAGGTEYNWQGAYTYCEAEGGRLPSVLELTGLLYRGALSNQQTDYWSRTGMFGYAFGANTKSKILSFDRFSDIDHVVCVRD